MRHLLLASAALLGLAVGGAHAQTASPGPGNDRSYPSGLTASRAGGDADADQYLRAARTAITQRRAGAAQEAIERAQTRLLDRAVTPSLAAEPVADPLVQQLSEARQALGRGDFAGANRIIGQVLAASGGTEPGLGGRAGLGPADTGSPVGGGTLGAGGGAAIGPGTGGALGADGSGLAGPGGAPPATGAGAAGPGYQR